MTTKTLLHTVYDVEKQAEDIVEKAEAAGKKRIQDLRDREEEAIEEVRAKAQEQGKKIIQEKVIQVENEVNTLKQQGETSAKLVHDSAERNRSEAVKVARDIFEKEYIS